MLRPCDPSHCYVHASCDCRLSSTRLHGRSPNTNAAGAGDRLGLTCEVTGEPLPAAMLPYCGRTMMEGLMRDLQAREYLYFRLTGRQVSSTRAHFLSLGAWGVYACCCALCILWDAVLHRDRA